MNDYAIYEFFTDEICVERQVHVVCARSVDEAVKFFMSRYTGVYSDEYTQYHVFNHALICVEAVNDRHFRIEWAIEKHEIAPGVLF